MSRFLAFLVAAFAVLFSVAAFAADASVVSTAVDIRPFLSVLVQIVAAVLGVVGVWAIKKALAYFKLPADSAANALLHAGLDRGIAAATAAISAKLASGPVSIDVKNALIASTVDYAQTHLPDTLTYLGVSPDKLKEIVAAKLDVALAAPAASASAS